MAKKRKQTDDAQAWEPLHDALEWDDVGGRLLANIARGMYPPQGVLREYVQNAADAYKDLQLPSDEHKIIITPSSNDLSIQDFGVGMDDHGIREAKKIAVSTKSDYDDRVGFRGIGIWAGLPACKRLIVDSTKAGHKYRYRLIFDFEDIMKHVDDNINIKSLVDPRYGIERHAADNEEHYTRVTLEGITTGYKKLLDVADLRRIASQVLPAAIDPVFQHHAILKTMLECWPTYSECHLYIQSSAGLEEVFRKFPEDDLEKPEEAILESSDGIEFARAWYCRTKNVSLQKETPLAVRGFQLRVKNFAVGDVNMFCAEQGYSYNIQEHLKLKTTARLQWFCGEIHVTNNDIKPNTPRDDLEREQAARLFIEQLRGFYKDRITEAGAYSEFNPFRNALQEAEKIIKTSNGGTSAETVIDASRIHELLKKLSDVPNKAKGESRDEDKNRLKQLLRQPWFKDGCAKAIAGLKDLLPASAEEEGGKPTEDRNGGTRTETNTGPSKKKTTEKRKPPDSTDVQKESEGTQSPGEELISAIFEVLERTFGDDCQELPQAQEEIQQIIDNWMVANAT